MRDNDERCSLSRASTRRGYASASDGRRRPCRGTGRLRLCRLQRRRRARKCRLRVRHPARGHGGARRARISGRRGGGRPGDRSRQRLSRQQPAVRLGADRRRRLRRGHRRAARRSVRQSARRRRRSAAITRPAPAQTASADHAGHAGSRSGGPDRKDVVVEAEGVSKHFGSLSVLSGVSFTARQGELVSIVGPNGAGKTTLIRCLADGARALGRNGANRGATRSTVWRPTASWVSALAANSRRPPCSKR